MHKVLIATLHLACLSHTGEEAGIYTKEELGKKIINISVYIKRKIYLYVYLMGAKGHL